ncbi:hypothetical protein AK812_SmicGene23290 [Symbiodinium microadriaticum]|uniref:EF-hand domain-containing protein n=1 Tax=Symbiodinium microadriaticum TaxID=2951 RepID=A0A1Q9DHL6_SYMMI|nr:hypothetical protein AK812_SmicGene23290 [Symbiodinium microadriaticum]
MQTLPQDVVQRPPAVAWEHFDPDITGQITAAKLRECCTFSGMMLAKEAASASVMCKLCVMMLWKQVGSYLTRLQLHVDVTDWTSAI